MAGKDRFFLSTSELTFQQDELQIEDERKNNVSVAIYPTPTNLALNKKPLKGRVDGMFTRFDIPIQFQKPIRAKLIQLQKEILPLRDIKFGKAKVAEMPTNNDFKNAAQWKIVLSETLDAHRDIYLRIPYIGDVARIYKGNELLTDNFYNGKEFSIRLKCFVPVGKEELRIEILPLQKNSLIYYPPASLPDFNTQNYAIDLPQIEIIEKKCLTLHATQ